MGFRLAERRAGGCRSGGPLIAVGLRYGAHARSRPLALLLAAQDIGDQGGVDAKVGFLEFSEGGAYIHKPKGGGVAKDTQSAQDAEAMLPSFCAPCGLVDQDDVGVELERQCDGTSLASVQSRVEEDVAAAWCEDLKPSWRMLCPCLDGSRSFGLSNSR